jgi:hypothetical protein
LPISVLIVDLSILAERTTLKSSHDIEKRGQYCHQSAFSAERFCMSGETFSILIPMDQYASPNGATNAELPGDR